MDPPSFALKNLLVQQNRDRNKTCAEYNGTIPAIAVVSPAVVELGSFITKPLELVVIVSLSTVIISTLVAEIT
jgi:hypothetical protein